MHRAFEDIDGKHIRPSAFDGFTATNLLVIGHACAQDDECMHSYFHRCVFDTLPRMLVPATVTELQLFVLFPHVAIPP